MSWPETYEEAYEDVPKGDYRSGLWTKAQRAEMNRKHLDSLNRQRFDQPASDTRADHG